MSKKHYQAIAAVMADKRRAWYTSGCGGNVAAPIEVLDWIDATAHALADYFATDNPKFDRARFLTACGVQS